MDHKRPGSSVSITRRSTRALFWVLVLLLCVALGVPVPQASALAVRYDSVPSSIAQQAAPTPQPAPATPFTAPQQLRFRHITDEDGLSSLRVTAVVQDRDGFMWFATTNGLDRYDGYQIVAYRNDPTNANSLSGNFINDVIQDHSGTLWLATNTGLNSFDPATGRFTRYLNDPANPQSLSGNTVNDVFEDRSGVLWVGTNTGLDSLDRATGRFTRYLMDPANTQSLSSNTVLVTYEDKGGVLWIGTDKGLNRFDRASGRFTRYVHDPANPKSLSYDSVWDILEDHADELWMTTDGGGLNRLDRATGTFDHFRHDAKDPHSLSVDRLDSLYEDASGALWVGTFGGGLSVLDPSRRTFSVYKHDPASPTSLSNDSVTYMYPDRSGLLWMATIGGGVEVYNPQQLAFTVYKHDPNTPSSLASDSVNAVYEDRNGRVWVGTRTSGLDRFTPGSNTSGQSVEFTHYPPDPTNPQRLGFPYVRSILQDRAGILWVGSYGDGLYRLDPATGIFTRYRHDPANPTSLSENRVNGIVETDDGQLWVATFGGLDRFDPKRGTFTSFLNDPSNPNSISDNFVWAITKDRSGNIWIGTRGAGLNRIEPATGKITRYRHDPNKPASLGDDGVDALLVDRAGVLWAGMFGGGLDRFNPTDGTFSHYRDGDGLASDEVLSLVEDGTPASPAGNIWAVTGHALSRLGQDRKTFRTYDATDGLPTTQYTFGRYVTPSGVLLIGSEQGLVTFDPANLRDDSQAPQVAITNFLLENKPVPIGRNSPLPQSINQTARIELTYTERVISFEFAALSYRAPARNRYRYKLEGFDADWTEVDSAHRIATYTNLDPGQYTFRVLASNADGVWNETGRAITLVIVPPWWETLWFRGLVALLAIVALFGAYRRRVTTLHRRQRALELAITERTADLAQTNAALQTEIEEHTVAEQALKQANVDLGRRVRELLALNEIAHALTHWTDLTGALQTVARTIAVTFGSTAIGIWLLEDSHLSLTRVVAAASDETLTDTDVVALADDPISEQLVARPQTRVIGASDVHPAIARVPHLPVGNDAGSCILLPLQSHGEVIGLVCIRATSPEHVFTPADTRLAEIVAGTLANAIENLSLFTEAQAAAAEGERRRLARDLHDSVSQALFAANLTAEVIPDVWDRNPKQGRASLNELHRFTSSALAEMRMLLIELRPKAILDTPLHELLLPLVSATSARSDANVEQSIDKAPQLPPDVKVAFYRLAQEALNNIVKHADAKQITVSLHFTPPAPEDSRQAAWSGKAEMLITDNGRGFDPVLAKRGRLGLDNMRERASGIEADLIIASSPGSGTHVAVTWIDPSLMRNHVGV
ncbi:MAG: two-component regulator propeller domain-containing protein [Chloroflexia bacterium]